MCVCSSSRVLRYDNLVISKSQTRLSDFTFTFHFHALEKETHSSVLAWRIPGTGEPGGLSSLGSHKSRTRLKRLSSSSSKQYSRFASFTKRRYRKASNVKVSCTILKTMLWMSNLQGEFCNSSSIPSSPSCSTCTHTCLSKDMSLSKLGS